MPRPQAKNLRNPEVVRRFPNGRIETISHSETTIGRFVFDPRLGLVTRRRSNRWHPLLPNPSIQTCRFGLSATSFRQLGKYLIGKLDLGPRGRAFGSIADTSVFDNRAKATLK
jgi:hypothetical protein